MHIIKLLRFFTFLIFSSLWSHIGSAQASFPSDYQVRFIDGEYRLLRNGTVELGKANSGIGCYQLGTSIKCMAINIDNAGAANCEGGIFDTYSNTNQIGWQPTNCGLFSIFELLTADRTRVKSYNSDLLDTNLADALDRSYPNYTSINLSLRSNKEPAIVNIYGSYRNNPTIFDNIVSTIDNILKNITNPHIIEMLDGQRFIILSKNDNAANMPGLQDIGIPDLAATSASFADINTTLISEDLVCNIEPAKFADHVNPPGIGMEEVYHQAAHTIQESSGLLVEIKNLFLNGTFGESTFVKSLKNTPEEFLPIITQAWFNSNFSYPGPKTRTDLYNNYPKIYNYLKNIFNSNNTWVPQCPAINSVKYTDYIIRQNYPTVINYYTYNNHRYSRSPKEYVYFRDNYRKNRYRNIFSYYDRSGVRNRPMLERSIYDPITFIQFNSSNQNQRDNMFGRSPNRRFDTTRTSGRGAVIRVTPQPTKTIPGPATDKAVTPPSAPSPATPNPTSPVIPAEPPTITPTATSEPTGPATPVVPPAIPSTTPIPNPSSGGTPTPPASIPPTPPAAPSQPSVPAPPPITDTTKPAITEPPVVPAAPAPVIPQPSSTDTGNESTPSQPAPVAPDPGTQQPSQPVIDHSPVPAVPETPLIPEQPVMPEPTPVPPPAEPDPGTQTSSETPSE